MQKIRHMASGMPSTMPLAGKWEVLLATKEALLLSTLESDESCSVFRKLAAEKLLFDPYSMSRSSDGSIIALGTLFGKPSP